MTNKPTKFNLEDPEAKEAYDKAFHEQNEQFKGIYYPLEYGDALNSPRIISRETSPTSEEENTAEKEEGALRYNSQKLRYELVPPLFNYLTAAQMTYGANKYRPNNWKLSVNDTRIKPDTGGLSYHDAFIQVCFGCLARHTEKLRSGEMIDPETGIHHSAAIMWNAGAIAYYQCAYGQGANSYIRSDDKPNPASMSMLFNPDGNDND